MCGSRGPKPDRLEILVILGMVGSMAAGFAWLLSVDFFATW
jgi:hypothetical protein